MCECFKPAFSEYDFGFGLGVGGDNFAPDEPFAYSLFAGVDHSNNSQVFRHLGLLIESLTHETERASTGELTEIPQFGIYWTPISEFQGGYIAGLKSLLENLTRLYNEVRDLPKGQEAFEDKILPWSESWQADNSKYDFMKVEPFAEDSDSWQIRIISITRSTLVTDLDPNTLRWLECEMFSAYPSEALLSEVWTALGPNSGKGVAFESEFGFTGPINLEQTRWSFEVNSICEEHWTDLVKFNSQRLAEAGIDVE